MSNRSVRFVLALLLLAFTPLTFFGAEPAPDVSNSLPDTIANQWRASGKARAWHGDECKGVPGGEIGLEYGLNAVTSRSYANGKERYQVEVFEMRFPSSAYGFSTFLQTAGKQKQFYAGRRVIRVQREQGDAPIAPEFLDALASLFPARKGNLPPLPGHLPATNKAAGEIYLIGPKALASHQQFGFLEKAVSFESGTEAVAADYQLGQEKLGLLLLEFHTPQLASDGMTKLDALKASLAEAQQSQLLLKRIGNYIAVANPVKDVKAAETLLGEIKYTAVVHWEGDKYSAIPLEYRPPDSAALEEASATALILLRTFYWIGLMLALAAVFGLLTGTSFFYWRRHQRRKAGLDDLFSDAGGTIRLNLDTDDLETEPKRKLLN